MIASRCIGEMSPQPTNPIRSGACSAASAPIGRAHPGNGRCARAHSCAIRWLSRVGIEGTSISIMKSPAYDSGKAAIHASSSACPVPGSAQIRPGAVAVW